ncbi:serine/threonine-protein kinase [Planctomycetota bacterium]
MSDRNGAMGTRRGDIESFVAVDEDTPETIRAQARDVATKLPTDGPGLAAGDRLGPYEVVSKLGAGGQAVVYRASHVHLGRDVAVKVPLREVAERLMREAKLLVKLEHPRIVRPEHLDPEGKRPFLVLELCQGGSLDDLIERFPEGLPLARVAEIGRAVLQALGHAHTNGVVHRDVKPSNILFDAAGTAKVCDFGIGTVAMSTELSGTLSSQTVMAGTPLYMAPEQEDPLMLPPGERIDGRADLFAFGKVLFCMLTGRRPRTFRPPTAYRDDLDQAWDGFCLKLTEEKREDRYQSAEEALTVLSGLPTGASEAVHSAQFGGSQHQAPGGAVPPHPPTEPAMEPLAHVSQSEHWPLLVGLLAATLAGSITTSFLGLGMNSDPVLVGGFCALLGALLALLPGIQATRLDPGGSVAAAADGCSMRWRAHRRLHGPPVDEIGGPSGHRRVPGVGGGRVHGDLCYGAAAEGAASLLRVAVGSTGDASGRQQAQSGRCPGVGACVASADTCVRGVRRHGPHAIALLQRHSHAAPGRVRDGSCVHVGRRGGHRLRPGHLLGRQAERPRALSPLPRVDIGRSHDAGGRHVCNGPHLLAHGEKPSGA